MNFMGSQGFEGAVYKILDTEGRLEVASKGKKFSGWASVPMVDLANEIIRPFAFEKHLHRYAANPVYCWMHDMSLPIGRVGNVRLDLNKGLYLEDITLVDMPIVEEFIWPLIKSGVVSQQSIGFLSLEQKEHPGGVLEHTEVYHLETSAVTVAMCPGAIIDHVKYMEEARKKGLHTVDGIISAVLKGGFGVPSDFVKSFAVNGLKVESEEPKLHDNKESGLEPHMLDVKAVSRPDDFWEKALEPSDPVDPKPHDRNYDRYMEATHLGYKDTSKGRVYLWPIGTPTKGGVALDFETLAVTMCRLAGARGNAHIDPEQKAIVLSQAKKAYGTLGKAFPEYKGVSLEDVAFGVSYKYSDVDWKENEPEIFLTRNVERDLKALAEAIAKGSFYNDRLKAALKAFYMSVDVFGYVVDEEDVAKLRALIATLYPEGGSEGLNAPSAYDEEENKLVKSFLTALREFKASL